MYFYGMNLFVILAYYYSYQKERNTILMFITMRLANFTVLSGQNQKDKMLTD